VNGALGIARPFTKAPALEKSLLERHRVLDELLTRSGITSVIELAAGLSQRGITFTEDPGIRYVEIDLPNMIEAKRKILATTERGCAALERQNFQMVEGDIASIDLGEIARKDAPVFVIAEGLLMYLDDTAQNKLFRAIADRLVRHGGAFAFDLLPQCEQKKPGVVGRGLGKAMKFFTRGGEFVRDERTRHDIARSLDSAGFANVELISPCPEQLIFSCIAKSTDARAFSAS
ncbi:MAG: class I SAM-dependent methyltransferase, partial [Polyangiaceae bacterium]